MREVWEGYPSNLVGWTLEEQSLVSKSTSRDMGCSVEELEETAKRMSRKSTLRCFFSGS